MKKMLVAICSCALTLSIAVTPALAADSNPCPNQNLYKQFPQFVRTLNLNGNQGNGQTERPNLNALIAQLFNRNSAKASNNFTFLSKDWSKNFFANICPDNINCNSSSSNPCDLSTCGSGNSSCDKSTCNTDCSPCDKSACNTDCSPCDKSACNTNCKPCDNSASCNSDDSSSEVTPSSSSESSSEVTPSSSSESSSSEETTPSSSESTSSEGDVSTYAYREFQKRVIELVNQERAAYGLPALKENAELDDVATLKSEDMAKLNYFSHTSPTYGSPFDMLSQFGIDYTAAGENIAMGQPTPESVMDAWMNSEGHRANILNSNYTQIGVGIAKNSNGQYIWTQTFLRP